MKNIKQKFFYENFKYSLNIIKHLKTQLFEKNTILLYLFKIIN